MVVHAPGTGPWHTVRDNANALADAIEQTSGRAWALPGGVFHQDSSSARVTATYAPVQTTISLGILPLLPAVATTSGPHPTPRSRRSPCPPPPPPPDDGRGSGRGAVHGMAEGQQVTVPSLVALSLLTDKLQPFKVIFIRNAGGLFRR